MRRPAIGFVFLITMMIPASALAAEPATPACDTQVPGEMAALWQRICHSAPADRPLAQMHGGLAALASGHAELAEQTFDRVLDTIETVYADTPEAERARSLWNAESVKDFKGEPFERMMAYYYRGVLALAKGDWDMAQATFQGAVLQDTMAATGRFRADNAAAMWLQGWSERCRGNTSRANDLFAEAAGVNPALHPPANSDTLLILAETGTGPLKFHAGRHGETLGIREGLIGNYRLDAIVDGQTVGLQRAEDLFFQATTRGGRPVDDILAAKADTKDTLNDVGRAALMAGAGTLAYSATNNHNNNNNDAAAAGLALLLIGVMAQAAADNVDAQADTRTWASLPHSIHLGTAPAATRLDIGRLELNDPAGRSVLSNHDAILVAKADRCQLVWIGNLSIAPSLAVAAEGAAPDQAGNCRTAEGGLALLPPDTCRRIGGAPLVGGNTLGSAAAAASRFSGNCRTGDGSLAELPADSCRRIGGQPL